MSLKYKKSIWIDFENTPHVYFFSPIIKRLKKYGFRFNLTARPFSQTRELAELLEIPVHIVGSRQQYKNFFLKALFLCFRAAKLFFVMIFNKPDIVLSHGSRALAIAAYFHRLPHIGFFDYDHSDTNLFHRTMTHVYVPEIALDSFNRIKKGQHSDFFFGYPGIKEEVYIVDHQFQGDILEKLNIPCNKVVAIFRPPAKLSHYANQKSDRLFNQILERALLTRNVYSIILSRYEKERAEYLNRFRHKERVRVLENVVDGLSLIKSSDLLIGGGGTMNREACVLGVPVYSVFHGARGAIDNWLESNQKLTFIHNAHDIMMILFVKKSKKAFIQNNTNVLDYITNAILKDYKRLVED